MSASLNSQPHVIDCQHGSEVWLAARRGLVTASRCADVIAVLKKRGAGGELQEKSERRNYRNELVVEILTGLTPERYVSREMEWGIEQEQFARAAYELEKDVMVETTGFVLHPEVAKFGASPDGLVGADGMIQIKCPSTATHLAWILEGKVPLDHAPQMLAEMACTGRMWNDFVSFDPRLPKHLQLFVRRFERDDALIAQLETEVVRFNGEIEDMLAKLPQAPDGGQPIVELLDYVADDELIV